MDKYDFLYEEQYDYILETAKKLDSVSPSMCLAKWLQVTIHLTTGNTASCHHNPVHKIDKNQLSKSFSALHNTERKKKERKLMREGKRPEACSYCWNIEDSGKYLSDRYYKSSRSWAIRHFQKVVEKSSSYNITPSFVEVNFNQACQFKCSYCSPVLSTTWMEEIQKYGSYPTTDSYNDIEAIKKKQQFPIGIKEKNPYVEAFWKWWPDLYPKLKVFRMTGGEPLIDHNTYRVLEYIKNNPNPALDLFVTSNLCPPEKMMMRFQTDLKEILEAKKISRFTLFASIDTWGKQAEYIRFGLCVKDFEKNVIKLIKKMSEPEFTIDFIATVNNLSVFSLLDLLKKILSWQQQAFYLHKGSRRKIALSLPYLSYPSWQALNVLPKGMGESYLKQCVHFMEENKVDFKKSKLYGFNDVEINNMKRLIPISNKSLSLETQRINKINFYKFFNEHDNRRQTNFLKTFPEMKTFWEECKKLSKSE